MLNWKKIINDHNKEFNGKCMDDTNPIMFRVKLKNYDVPLLFKSNNKAFGDYLGYSVYAYDEENDRLCRIERDLKYSNIEFIELVEG